ncbi:MAG: hypothetical protein AB1767_09975 [Bacillota bacterium]
MDRELENLIFKLLEPGVFKTTAQLVEEFRAEYPRQWRRLEQEGEQLYGGSCGAYQQPATRIAQVLFNLAEEKRCRQSRRGKEHQWSAVSTGEQVHK